MKIDKKEVLRYLSYHGEYVDPSIAKLIDKAIGESMSKISPKSIYLQGKFHVAGDSVNINGITFISKDLTKYLLNCQEIYIMAATLGVQSDFLIRKAQSEGSSSAAIMQAVLTAYIEGYCDEIQEKIALETKEEGLFLKNRFSPGYGDLPLEAQRSFFSLMEITKRIGISLSDHCIMSPSKSVTAFIGVTRERPCNHKSCSLCKATECEFRRTGYEEYKK